MSIREKPQMQGLANLWNKNVQFSEIQFKDKSNNELKQEKVYKAH